MRGTWKAVALYPPSWIAIAAVVVAVALILVLLEPSTLYTVVVAVVGILAILAWPVTLSATGTLDRLRSRGSSAPRVSETDVRMLEDQLERLGDAGPVEQLRGIRDGRDKMVNLLDRRRQAGETIYERYRTAATRVYATVIANLKEILAGTSGAGSPAGSPSSMVDQRTSELLADNALAIAVMDRASTTLGNTPIGLQSPDAVAALDALREFADRR